MAAVSEPIRDLASARGGETAQQEYRRYGIEQLQETMDRAVNAMDEANEWARSLPMIPFDLRPLIADMAAKLRVLRDELSSLRVS